MYEVEVYRKTTYGSGSNELERGIMVNIIVGILFAVTDYNNSN